MRSFLRRVSVLSARYLAPRADAPVLETARRDRTALRARCARGSIVAGASVMSLRSELLKVADKVRALPSRPSWDVFTTSVTVRARTWTGGRIGAEGGTARMTWC